MLTKKLAKITCAACTGIMLAVAGAAYTISDFPTPFISDGKVQEDLAIIVGSRASSSDVISALDIGMFLQKSAKTNETVEVRTGPLLAGDAAHISSTSDRLEINDTIGTVRETLTETDLELLKGG